MPKNKYIVQPEGLSTMSVEADRMEKVDDGVMLVKDGEDIYWAPNAHTKYVCKDGAAVIQKNKHLRD